MQKSTDEVPWSLYWAEDRLHSCVASGADADQQTLNKVWSDFALRLPAGAKVLDLACGNGAVASAMLSTQPALVIDAVDQADIAPQQFLEAHPELEKVVFHANTDINQLDFNAASFDALTSQFGIEYAGLTTAAESSVECLASGGLMCFIIHHKQSGIIQSSQLKLSEMKQLLDQDGLIECLLRVLRGEVDFAVLETLGAEYLAAKIQRTEQISGRVFAGINQIATTLQSDPKQAYSLGATLKLRLDSEYQRLLQMDSAAQDELQMSQFGVQLEQLGMQIGSIEPFFADHASGEALDQYLLGWLVQANKL